jgi:hypothetical protein
MIKVYSFQCFDLNVGETIVPPFKATEATIKHLFRGEVLPLTGELVERSELDSDGRWFRVATGWDTL